MHGSILGLFLERIQSKKKYWINNNNNNNL